MGRFINADGLIGQTGDILGHNLYAYTQNNPVMYYDPTGYIAWAIPGAIIGAVVGGVAGAAISYYTTGEVDWRYVAGGAVAGALVGAGVGYLAQSAYATTAATGASTAGGVLTADGDPTNEVNLASEYVDDIAQGVYQGFKTYGANANAVGNSAKAGQHLHHIVAQTHSRAEPARQVLTKYGINVHNSINTVPLNSTQHSGLHTYAYIDRVNSLITTSTTRQEVYGILMVFMD
jgi:hypothetical protein